MRTWLASRLLHGSPKLAAVFGIRNCSYSVDTRTQLDLLFTVVTFFNIIFYGKRIKLGPDNVISSYSADSNHALNDGILNIDLKYITLKRKAALSEIRSAKSKRLLEEHRSEIAKIIYSKPVLNSFVRYKSLGVYPTLS